MPERQRPRKPAIVGRWVSPAASLPEPVARRGSSALAGTNDCSRPLRQAHHAPLRPPARASGESATCPKQTSVELQVQAGQRHSRPAARTAAAAITGRSIGGDSYDRCTPESGHSTGGVGRACPDDWSGLQRTGTTAAELPSASVQSLRRGPLQPAWTVSSSWLQHVGLHSSSRCGFVAPPCFSSLSRSQFAMTARRLSNPGLRGFFLPLDRHVAGPSSLVGD